MYICMYVCMYESDLCQVFSISGYTRLFTDMRMRTHTHTHTWAGLYVDTCRLFGTDTICILYVAALHALTHAELRRSSAREL